MPAPISTMPQPVHDYAATDTAVAEFLASADANEPSVGDGSGPEGGESDPGDDGVEGEGAPEGEGGAAGAGDDGAAAAAEGSEEVKASPAPAGVDAAALTKAIEAEDPLAFVKALGEHADKLLTGKAHKALRLQVRELEDKATAATAAQAKADSLATQLGKKYGDPIAARTACNKGDVGAFLDMIEKWSGHSWNDVQRWVAAGLAGKPQRVTFQERNPEPAAPAVDPAETARQEQAQAEVKAWAEKGVKSLAPDLDFPEAQELVLEEIREGVRTGKGVNTPAKAIPIVRKKLQERYERLHAVFGKGKPAKTKTPSPSTKVARSESNGKTRPTTIDEDIRDFLRSEGLS
jgi:hypothetical protein